MTPRGVMKKVLADQHLFRCWEMSPQLPTHAQVYMQHICHLAAASDTPGQVAFDRQQFGTASLAATLAWGARRFGRETEAQEALDALTHLGFITVEADNLLTLPVLVRAHAARSAGGPAAETGKHPSRRSGAARGGRPRNGESSEEAAARREAGVVAGKSQTSMMLVQTGGRTTEETPPAGLDPHAMIRSTLSVVPVQRADSAASSDAEQPLPNGNLETGLKPKPEPEPETASIAAGFVEVSEVSEPSSAVAAAVQEESIIESTAAAADLPPREAQGNRNPKPKPKPKPVVLFPQQVPPPTDLNGLVALATKKFGWGSDRRVEARLVFGEILTEYEPWQLKAEIEATRRCNGARFFQSGQMVKNYGPPRSLAAPAGVGELRSRVRAKLDPRVTEYGPWQDLPVSILTWCNRALEALDHPDQQARARTLTFIRDQSRLGDIRRSNDGEVWRLLLERFPRLEEERDPQTPGRTADG